MRKKFTRSGARRSGDDYQDIVAIDYLVKMLEHPNRYQWIKLEADDAMHLDDIVVCNAKDKLDAIQVKFSTNPEGAKDAWTWEDILKQKKGVKGNNLDSLFQKWFKSYSHLNSALNRAALVTNRSAADDIMRCLHGNIVRFEKIEISIQERIVKQAGDDKDAVLDFLSSFEWCFDQPDLESYENFVKQRFFKIVGEDEQSWYLLKESVNVWINHKDYPTADGKIFINHLRSAIKWDLSPSIPQGFEVPQDYVIPDENFHKSFVNDVLSSKEGRCVVISGKPGIGKSTYLSNLVQFLKSKKVPVVRHHYFLSLSDHTSSRYEHKKIIESLMNDLTEIEYIKNAINSEELKILNQRPQTEFFNGWLDALSRYFGKNDQQLIIIIDGLDHVWRDQDDITELKMLFDFLLPVYDNICLIVGTQPVDDKYLPNKLLEHALREKWHSLPYLNDEAIKKWINTFVENNKINPFEQNMSVHYKQRYAENILSEMKKKSLGHPLIIKYIFREIIENNYPFSPESIEGLNGNPDQDIEHYYSSLWRAIQPDSRSILCIFAASSFTWQSSDIIECINHIKTEKDNTFQSWREVSHLFKDTLLGYIPFHPSLLQFVKKQSEYKNQENLYLRTIEKWLTEKAPPYWMWAYTWEVQARLGEFSEIIEKIGRDWVIESIALGYPVDRILELCELCKVHCFQQKNYQKLAEVSQLAIYVEHFTSEYPDLLGEISYSQLYLKEDGFIIDLWKATLNKQSSGRLSAMADEMYKYNNEDVWRDINDILYDRLANIETSYELADVLPFFFETLFLNDSNNSDIETIFENIKRHRRYDNHSTVLKGYIDALIKRKKHSTLLKLISQPLTSYESYMAANGYVISALIEGFTVNEWDTILTKSPLAVFCGWLSKRDLSLLDINSVFNLDPSFLEFEDYKIGLERRKVVDGFYNVFFYYFTKQILIHKPSKIDVYHQHAETWQGIFVKYLQGLAAKYSQRCKRSSNFDFLAELLSIKPPELPSLYYYHENNRYYEPACESFIHIVVTLILAERMFYGFSLSRDHLIMLIENPYFDLWHFLKKILMYDTLIIDSDAVGWINDEYGNLKEASASIIRDFGAHRYALLAQLNSKYDYPEETKSYIRKAINCGIVYGYHKDPFAYNMLECLHEAYDATADDVQIKRWIDMILPSLVALREYTDGRAYHDFTGELLFKIDPLFAMSYYDFLIEKEEYHGALYVFHEILRAADFDDYSIRMLGNTALDNESIKILLERMDDNSNISDVIGELSKAVGPLAIEFCQNKMRKEQEKQNDNDGKEIINYSDYPINKRDEFVGILESERFYYIENYITEWFAYWKPVYSTDERLKALDYFMGNLKFNSNKIKYDLIFERDGCTKAFPYLIKYFNDKRGWSVYGLSDKQFRDVIDMLKRNHNSQIDQFFMETIVTDYISDPLYLNLNINYLRLVRYFFAINNKTAAFEIIEGTLKTYMGLVKPFNVEQIELSVEQMNMSNFGIEMIMRRLLWVSPMVREQACKIIAKLYINPDISHITKSIYLEHLARQQLESRVVVFLLPLFRAKAIKKSFQFPAFEELEIAIKKPSYLSNMLMTELDYKKNLKMDVWNEVPGGFTGKNYSKSLISRFPRMIRSIIKDLGLYSGKIMTRWAFEIETIIESYDNIPSPSAGNIGGIGFGERFLRLETPLFEIGHSALLRMISWATDQSIMSNRIGMLLSLFCLPLDLDSLKIDFSNRPMWLPQTISNLSNEIDTVTPSLMQIASELTSNSIDSCKIAYFAARFVESDNENYDLTIQALYQQCHGSNIPDYFDINSLNIRPPIMTARESLYLCTDYKSVLNKNAEIKVKDWTLIPATSSLIPHCPSFWHTNRRQRCYCINVPYLPDRSVNKQITMQANTNGIDFFDDKKLIGRWFDWVENMQDQAYANLPQNIGRSLLIKDGYIESFCQTHGYIFCWLVTVTRYSNTRGYGEFEVSEYKEIIGATHLILPRKDIIIV